MNEYLEYLVYLLLVLEFQVYLKEQTLMENDIFVKVFGFMATH